MSASSGLKGICPICAHAYHEHNRYACEGKDRMKGQDGKKTWAQCAVWWYICQQRHQTKRRNAYQVCHDCPRHPGGGPSGSEPGGTFARAEDCHPFEGEWDWDTNAQAYYRVDEEGIFHWYGETVAGPSTEQSAATNVGASSSTSSAVQHTRGDSRDSEDPLGWTQQQYDEATVLADLTSAFDRTRISEATATSQQEAEEVETYTHGRHICFKDDKGHEYKTVREDWKENTLDDGTQLFYWISPRSGRSFCTYTLAKGKKHRKH